MSHDEYLATVYTAAMNEQYRPEYARETANSIEALAPSEINALTSYYKLGLRGEAFVEKSTATSVRYAYMLLHKGRTHVRRNILRERAARSTQQYNAAEERRLIEDIRAKYGSYTPLDSLDVCCRVINTLKRNKINSVEQLKEQEDHLAGLHGLGVRGLYEITKALGRC